MLVEVLTWKAEPTTRILTGTIMRNKQQNVSCNVNWWTGVDTPILSLWQKCGLICSQFGLLAVGNQEMTWVGKNCMIIYIGNQHLKWAIPTLLRSNHLLLAPASCYSQSLSSPMFSLMLNTLTTVLVLRSTIAWISSFIDSYRVTCFVDVIAS